MGATVSVAGSGVCSRPGEGVLEEVEGHEKGRRLSEWIPGER